MRFYWVRFVRPRVFALLTTAVVLWSCAPNSLQRPEETVEERAPASPVPATIGPELSVDADQIGPTERLVLNPVVASDGAGNTLLVWTDSQDIYARRVGPSGQAIDPPIPVSRRSTQESYPSVARGTSSWLVVWVDASNGAEPNVLGARVGDDGTLLDETPIEIGGASGAQSTPTVAYNGMNWLVTWSDRRGSLAAIYSARVEDDGDTPDAGGLPVAPSGHNQEGPQVAVQGTSFFVVWAERLSATDSDIAGARIDETGTSLDPAGIPLISGPYGPWPTGLAYNGTNWLLAWERSTNGAFVSRFEPNGVLLDPEPLILPSGSAGGTRVLPAGDGWIALYSSGYGISGLRVDAQGGVIDGSSFRVTDAGMWPNLIHDGTRWLAFWTDVAGNVYVVALDVDGNILPETRTLVTSSPVRTYAPAVSFGEDEWLLVWNEVRSGGNSRIYGTRVAADGTLRDDPGFGIPGGSGPAVAYNGTDWLVASGEGGGPTWARVSTAGVPLDSFSLSPQFPADDVALASDGVGWFLVWSERRPGVPARTFGARIASDGTIVDEPAELGAGFSRLGQRSSGVAYASGMFLATWRETDGIHATRIDASGAPLDVPSIVIRDSVLAYAPGVASTGAGWLVTWEEERDGAASSIYGARIDTLGIVLDPAPFAVADAPARELTPAPSQNGPGWLVAWIDQTSGKGDVRAARVGSGGGVLDPGGFDVSSDKLDESSVVLSPGRGGDYLFAYARNDPDREPHATVKARLVHVDCTPISSVDATCDGVDDDCSDSADEDYAPTAVVCPSGSCTLTGTSRCVAGRLTDDCAPVSDAPCAAGGNGGTGGGASIDEGGESGRESGSGGSSGGSGGVTAGGGSGGAPRGGTAGIPDDAAGEGGSDAGQGGAPGSSGEGGRAAAIVRRSGGCGCRTSERGVGGSEALLLAALLCGARTRRRRRVVAGSIERCGRRA